MQYNLDTGTFLSVAARLGMLDLVKRLVEKFNVPINFLRRGRTPLDYAEANWHTKEHGKVVAYLTRVGGVTSERCVADTLSHF